MSLATLNLAAAARTVANTLRPNRPDTDLELTSDLSFAARNRLAMKDFTDAVRLWRLGWTLGWFDIRLRYRGSMIGPFWLTLSTAVMVAALGVLYSTLFHIPLHDYLPYLAISQILWMFIGTMVSDACACFTSVEGVVRSVRMPFHLHAFRTVVRNILILGHNVVVVVAVYAFFHIWPDESVLLIVPALAIWVVNSVAVCLLLGAFCARFRDISPIVASVMQIAFFVSPVIWKPEQLGRYAKYLVLNPFYSLLEIVRGPLLNDPPGMLTWVSAIIYTLLLCALSWLFFIRARGRLAFWL
jgi:lipopolysaccharide transport system permease protein